MYAGVPRMAPDWVSSTSASTFLASPKSVTCGWPSVVDQDVGRLEVAVEDAAGMRVGHRLGGLGDQPGGGPRVVAVAGHQRHQAAAGDELHA